MSGAQSSASSLSSVALDHSAAQLRYRSIFNALDIGFCVLEVRFDPDGRAADYRFVEVNPAFESQTGLKDAEGRWMRDLAPDHERHWFDIYGEVALTGQPAVFENPAAALDRWFEVHAYRIGEPDERQVAVLFQDITQRRRAELALRESEARFRDMADCAPAPVWVTSAEGPVEFVNAAFAELLGRPREELLGDAWVSYIHPEDLPEVAAVRQAARAKRESYVFEARFKAAAGWRIMRASSRPRFDESGCFAGYVGIAADLTDIRNAEARQRLLINELNHRVKNTLAAVQSLVHQTVRGEAAAEQARQRLVERLLALSGAHNVLTRESWEGAELREIIDETLKPYAGLGGSASPVRVECASVWLSPNIALAFSMALHELATNAAKYGALSADGGQVLIECRSDEDEIEVVWREEGGPPVTKPSASGFGLRLLERGLAAELGSSAKVEFHPDGVVCTLRAARRQTGGFRGALTSPADSPT